MGLSRAGMQRMEKQLNAAAEEVWAGLVRIDGVSYGCSCAGGRTVREFDEHGLAVTRRECTIRVRRELLADAPAIGTPVEWTPSGGTMRRLRVVETPDRPAEVAWAIRCEEV